MVKKHLGDKLVGHISGDSTSIEAMEKAHRKVKTRKPKKRGRPFKGSVRMVLYAWLIMSYYIT